MSSLQGRRSILRFILAIALAGLFGVFGYGAGPVIWFLVSGTAPTGVENVGAVVGALLGL